MTRIKFMGLCVAAVLAAMGVMAASASAAVPTWYECAKLTKNMEGKYTGKYTEKLCVKEATPAEVAEGKHNKYELKEGLAKGKSFKGKGGPLKLHVKSWLGDITVNCESSKSSGKPALPNLEKEITVTFKKCALFGSKKCTSKGAKAGEVVVSGLEGELGYIKGEKSPVGLKIMSEKEPGKGELELGGVFAEFECGEGGYVKAALAREAIGEVTGDINVISKESTLTDAALEQYGEHEFETKKYVPKVNIIGWENEVAAIEACSGLECAETEHPAHVIVGEFCGTFIEEELKKECTPPTYSGLEATLNLKGDYLMIKT